MANYPINIWVINEDEFDEFTYTGGKVIYIAEEISPRFQTHPAIITAGGLLPPMDAIRAELDGSMFECSNIYEQYLQTEEADPFISIIIAAGLRQIPIGIMFGKDEMNFHKEMEEGMPATEILIRALELMKDEMEHSEESLSLAMYEYAGTISKDMMDYFNKIGEQKWTDLINYGIARGEFREVDVFEMVNVILYVYQGVRMWSRIVSMTSEVFDSITDHIRKQLIKEERI